MAEQPTNLSDYELQRLAHIRRNHEFLVSLGLADAVDVFCETIGFSLQQT